MSRLQLSFEAKGSLSRANPRFHRPRFGLSMDADFSRMREPVSRYNMPRKLDLATPENRAPRAENDEGYRRWRWRHLIPRGFGDSVRRSVAGELGTPAGQLVPNGALAARRRWHRLGQAAVPLRIVH